MKLCSLASLIIIISLAQFACEKQPVPPPVSPTPKDSAATPSNSSTVPAGQAEAAASPQLQKTPAATVLSAAAGNSSTPHESVTPADAALLIGGRPVFKNQAANDYLKSYDAYIEDFKAAYEDMKQGKLTKYEAVIARAAEVQSKGERIQSQLNPEEQKEFSAYLARKAQELGQANRNQ